MSDDFNLIGEILPDGRKVKVKFLKEGSSNYMTYCLPHYGFEDYSEQKLIKLVSNFDSFRKIPHEYTRQAGISDETDEDGNSILELTFALGSD